MDRRWPIIGIAGLAGAGKDTVAQRLVERWGFTRVGFADAMKREVRATFRKTLLTAWESWDEGGNVPEDPENQEHLLDIIMETKPPVVRALLQEYGTELRRAEDPDYWVGAWLNTCSTNWDRRLVAPDTRFDNEATTIKRWGQLVKVVRPGHVGAGAHQSETGTAAWPDSAFDVVFQNDGTIVQLWEDVDAWVALQYERWR